MTNPTETDSIECCGLPCEWNPDLAVWICIHRSHHRFDRAGEMVSDCGHDRTAETRIAAVRALAERWRNAKTWQGDPDIVSTAYGTLLLEALDAEEGSQV